MLFLLDYFPLLFVSLFFGVVPIVCAFELNFDSLKLIKNILILLLFHGRTIILEQCCVPKHCVFQKHNMLCSSKTRLNHRTLDKQYLIRPFTINSTDKLQIGVGILACVSWLQHVGLCMRADRPAVSG